MYLLVLLRVNCIEKIEFKTKKEARIARKEYLNTHNYFASKITRIK